MKDLRDSQAEPVTIYEDNQSAICIARNPRSHNKTKHVDIKYHYVRDKVQDATTEVQYCPTNGMIADVLTKGLTHERFARLHALAGVKQSDFG
jgi:KUP system potassium uptake protein